MAELLLIARVAGRRIAFPASAVEAVVELEGITPVPGAAPHVAGLAALRSRVLTAVDCLASLGLGYSRAEGLLEAIVVPSGGHAYALLVESVDDVVEAGGPPAESRAPLGQGWERIGTGLVEVEGELLLLVDPAALIAGPVAEAA